MFLNIRGLKSKLSAVNELLETENPTMMCLVETHLKKEDDIGFDGYTLFRNERESKDGGGILVAIKNELKNVAVEVEQEKENGESIWFVVDNKYKRWGTAIRFGVIYAPQESRTKLPEYKQMYKKIEEQVRIGKEKNQKIVLMGDFNCKVGLEIEGNKEEVSKSAKYLLKLEKNHNLKVMNRSKVCAGKWTRVEGDCKSVLDYVLISEDDEKSLMKMVIDEGKKYAPIGLNVECEEVYSDHNTIVCEFDWLIDQQKKEERKKVITKRGYQKIAEQIEIENLKDIFDKTEKNLQEKYTEWKSRMNDVIERNKSLIKKDNKNKTVKKLLRARRQIKKTKSSDSVERRKMVERIKLINGYIKEEESQQYARKINKVVEKMKMKGGINGANTWEVLKQLKGRRTDKATSILSKDGEVLSSSAAILNRHKEHFYELLQIKPASTEKEKEIEKNINGQFERLLKVETTTEPLYTTREEVEESLKGLKERKCADGAGWRNEILKRGGEGMVDCLHALFNEIEREKRIPEEWNNMIIRSLHKKGNVHDMNNKRGIFLTNVISKLYEKVVKDRNKQKVDSRVSKNQVGGKTGRSTSDHMIVVVDRIQRNKRLGKKTYFVFGDAVKCFDKLWLRDCLIELYKAGVLVQDIGMLYRMNEEAKIKIRTPLGETDEFTCHEIVKQGTIWGPEMCCIETDSINRLGERNDSNVGKIAVGILGYVDDILGGDKAEAVRKTIRKMRQLETEKKYTFGIDKTKYMVINTGREAEEMIEEEIERGKVTKTDEYKYIGLWLNKEGNLKTHIETKKKAIMGEVTQMKILGSKENVGHLYLCTRLMLFEACIIPSLLHQIEAWWPLLKKAELKQLEGVQGKILRNLLHLPKTTPYWGILHETGTWTIKWRLVYKMIMLFHNIMVGDEDRLAKEVLEQQVTEGHEESFVSKVLNESAELGIWDITELAKSELKKRVKEAIKEKMETEIANEATRSSKLRFITGPISLERADYINEMDGDDAVEVMKTKLNMLNIHDNYRNDIKKQRKCPHCKENKDTTEHFVSCPVVGGKDENEKILFGSDAESWRKIMNIVRTNKERR